MKRIIGLLLVLCALVGYTEANAQACDRSDPQKCYTYGYLTGADKTSDASWTSQGFEVFSSFYCPAGRINCNNAPQKVYRVVITRLQGTGTITTTGVSNSTATTVNVDFPLAYCGSSGQFLVFATRTSPGTAVWQVELISASFGGVVCDSNIYTITLTP